MSSEPSAQHDRDLFSILAERIAPDAWHLTVRELPLTWTVAFGRDELEPRARERIALDTGCHPQDFDIRVVEIVPGAA